MSMGYKNSLLLVMAGMLLSCSSNNDELSGKKFEGYYETCERITIDFDSDSRVTGQISSTDFVGNFSDYIYGHYKYNAPNIVIVWEKIDDDNEKHKSILPNPDSVIINESLDTLWLYEGRRKYVLPEYRFFHIDKSASVPEQIGFYIYMCFLFLIVFLCEYFFQIIFTLILVLIIFFVWKRIKKKKQEKR